VSATAAQAETDVVVVGTGAAALVAAIAAHDGGARVRIVEKSGSVGGTTAVSGGGIWMPQNHRMVELGIEDSREEALTYIGTMTAGRTPGDLLARFVDEGPAIVAGLERSTTLQLRSMTWPDYHPEMEGAKSSGRMLEPALFDTSVLGPWAQRLRRAPILGMPMTLQESTVEWRPAFFPERFDLAVMQERIAAHQVACGQALIAGLLAGCLARGIEPELETSARELVMAGDSVAGLVVERSERAAGDGGGGGTVIPASAVVLASGGFEWNATLRSQFLAGPLTHPHSPPSNEGDGLLMAMAAGAELGNLTETWWYPASHIPGEEYDGHPLSRFVGIERTAPHSIIVNRFGERFVNEAANYNDMMKAFFSFDANEYSPRHLPCWVVFDHQYRSRYGVVTTRPGDPDPPWLLVHDTVVGLGKAAGIDPEGLLDTVERWNRQVRDGCDRDFGRGSSAYDRFHGDSSAPHPNLGTIEEGPFYALPIYIGSVGTKGGPRVDADGRIQHVQDRPIPGLYGAGNVIASPAGPAYYGGGTSIGMAVVWGHLAGSHAAAFSTTGVSTGTS
jgi:succinate dehydrogenase/fumarate reductase flavoprotein subunit